jgi:hypothetical protein
VPSWQVEFSTWREHLLSFPGRNYLSRTTYYLYADFEISIILNEMAFSDRGRAMALLELNGGDAG